MLVLLTPLNVNTITTTDHDNEIFTTCHQSQAVSFTWYSFLAVPKCSQVYMCAACISRIFSRRFWTPVLTQKTAPDIDSYSASAVFPHICSVSFGDTAPDCVDTVAFPEAWQQPWREGPEKWIGPLALTSFPVHLFPDHRGYNPHSWVAWPVLIMLGILLASPTGHWLSVFMSSLKALLEPSSTRAKNYFTRKIAGDLKTFRLSPAEHSLHSRNPVEKEIHPKISGRMP